MWGNKPGYEYMVAVVSIRTISNRLNSPFRRCGGEAEQWRNTAEKVEPVNFRSRNQNDEATPAEIAQ